MTHPLDRPVWNALTSEQAHLAVVKGAAVRMDPALDPIRSDPRFARLSERIEREMGLP